MKKIKKTKIEIAPKPVLYAVLRLNKKVEYTEPLTGKTIQIEVGGCAGYIPVFATIEEAKKSSQNGKYQITCIAEE